MTTTFIFSSILFLLATFVWHCKAETFWTTDSNAEEEEEKRQNILFGNESLQTSPLPFDSTTKPNFIEKLLAKGRNALWNRGGNISDYDELHEESKHDASPENSVDKDSLDNVNYFLQENPDVETSTHMDLQREPTTSEPLVLFLHREENLPSSLESSLQNDKELVSSLNCASGDENCKSPQLTRTDELGSEFRGKVFPSTTITLSPSLWNMVKSLNPQDRSSTELPTYASTLETSDMGTVTVSSYESSSAQTSDNIILIEGTELNKDESMMQGHSNKSEKLKPLKPDAILEDTSSESLLLKLTIAPTVSLSKESTFEPDIRLLSSLLFTKILNISSTPSSFTTEQTPFLIPSVNSRVESKSNIYFSSEHIIDEKQVGNIPSVDYSKELLDYTTPSSSITPSEFRYNAKSNIPPSEYKPTKARSEKLPDLTPVIFSSFKDSTQLAVTTSSVPNVESIMPSLSTTLDVHSFATTSSTPILTTPVLESEIPSRPVVQESTVHATVKEDLVPPPRLSNPSCSSLPVCIEITLLETTWEQFCSQIHEFREFLSKSVSHYTRPIHPHHIVLDAEVCTKGSIRPLQTTPDIAVAFYVTDDSGEYEERMTEICGVILRKWPPTAFRSSVMEVRLFSSETQSTPIPLIPELNSGFVAAVSISAVAGVALCLLCILLVIMKQKLMQGRNSDTTTPTADAYSLDSLSITASFRRRRTRRSARSYLNHAFSDQEIPSHPLNEKTLVNCLKSRDLLEEEFKKIPMNMPKLDAIPEGAHVKNRYSNILPKPESRVLIAEPSGDPLKCYINANFVKGYEGKSAFYIACQAPLPEGIEDFWRMVWEQQCRVIVMLTQFEENGVSRCAMYFPQSTLVSQPPFGDFQVSLLKKDVYEFYTMSTLRLLDLEKNLFRDIVHLWFTGWPDVGVPKDPTSLITFVQQCRPYINCNSGPTIVHCSTGTGRTGVFLTMDICMREYEESRSIDILQCVSQLRRDRGGAVQNKDQYILIYEAMLEYISRVANQSDCPSLCSKNS